MTKVFRKCPVLSPKALAKCKVRTLQESPALNSPLLKLSTPCALFIKVPSVTYLQGDDDIISLIYKHSTTKFVKYYGHKLCRYRYLHILIACKLNLYQKLITHKVLGSVTNRKITHPLRHKIINKCCFYEFLLQSSGLRRFNLLCFPLVFRVCYRNLEVEGNTLFLFTGLIF